MPIVFYVVLALVSFRALRGDGGGEGLGGWVLDRLRKKDMEMGEKWRRKI